MLIIPPDEKNDSPVPYSLQPYAFVFLFTSTIQYQNHTLIYLENYLQKWLKTAKLTPEELEDIDNRFRNSILFEIDSASVFESLIKDLRQKLSTAEKRVKRLETILETHKIAFEDE